MNKLAFALVGVSMVAGSGCGSDMPMVTAQGVVFNINKFAGLRAMGMDGVAAFGASVVAGQQIATSESMDEKSAPSAADGSFSAKVPANGTFFMVASENAEFVRTMTVAPVTTAGKDVQLVAPVVACPEVAETTIVANGAGISVTELISRGFAVFATDALPAPPNDIPVVNSQVTLQESTDFDLYQFQGGHTGGLETVKGNSSPIALYAVVPHAKADSRRELHVSVTDPMGAHQFDPIVVPVDSGFFSSALALSTH